MEGNMKSGLTLAGTALILILALSPVAARADIVTLTLDNPVLTVSPGDTVTFLATVSAPDTNSAAVYLNGDTIDPGASPFTASDSDFFNNFPFFLNPGDSFDGALFTVTLNPDAAVGTDYSGTFILEGGSDGSAQDTLASPNFTIDAVAVTPEPSYLLAVGAGLAAVLAWRKRKQRGVCAGVIRPWVIRVRR
jgi:hypothetical protein